MRQGMQRDNPVRSFATAEVFFQRTSFSASRNPSRIAGWM
jgi:hypothetical protein